MEWCMITAAMSYLILLFLSRETGANIVDEERIGWGITEIREPDEGFM